MRVEPGLCGTCAHAKCNQNTRGSVFWQCLKAQSDSRFSKYPPLPVLRCHGFEMEGRRDDEG